MLNIFTTQSQLVTCPKDSENIYNNIVLSRHLYLVFTIVIHLGAQYNRDLLIAELGKNCLGFV